MMHSRFENYYQSIIFAIIKTAGFDTHVEEQTNLGRIDMVVFANETIFLMEFKTRGSAEQALEQIETKKYAQKYLMRGKKIVLVGIFIDVEKRNIDSWVSKAL